jgi:hypothetical protein
MIFGDWNLLGFSVKERLIAKIRRLTVKRLAQFLVFLLLADSGVEVGVFLVVGFSEKAGPYFLGLIFLR